MQKITIKTVTPGLTEKSPTVIVAVDGTKMSGFDKKLNDLLPGSMIEVELEVKGKFNNIKEWKLLQEVKSTPAAAGSSLYTKYTNEQIAVFGTVQLLVAGTIDKESLLGKQVFAWLTGHLPELHITTQPVLPMEKKPVGEVDLFANVGQLLEWAWKTYKLNSSKTLVLLGIEDTAQIKDFSEARKKIIESQVK